MVEIVLKGKERIVLLGGESILSAKGLMSYPHHHFHFLVPIKDSSSFWTNKW